MELIENVLQFLVTLLGFVFRGFIIAGAVNRYIFCSPVFMDALHWALFTGHFI